MIRDSRLLAAAFALLLVWAPLPFGSVTPGFAAALGVAVLAIAAVGLLARPDLPTPRVAIPGRTKITDPLW